MYKLKKFILFYGHRNKMRIAQPFAVKLIASLQDGFLVIISTNLVF